MAAVGRNTKRSCCCLRAAKMIAKTTRKTRDPRMTKNYFRAHIAIMNPSHPGQTARVAGGCRAALQVPFAEAERNSDHSCRNAAE